MKKLFLGSLVLLLFSFSILIFQASCKKTATAQTSYNCPQTSTIIFEINFPSNFSVSTTVHSSNNISIENENLSPEPNYKRAYWQAFKDVGTAHKKTYIFENVIPGKYEYKASAVSTDGTSFIQANIVPITLIAGQTYNITINNTDFH
jgi:hypothetical protein